MLDQDPLLMDMFDIIEGKINEERKRQQDKATRKRK